MSSVAEKKLERDLERAFYRYYLRVGENKSVQMEMTLDPRIALAEGQIDTENLTRSDIDVTVKRTDPKPYF